jgi:hypothetical protein
VNVYETFWNVWLSEIASNPANVSPQKRLEWVRSSFADCTKSVLESNTEEVTE